jgi:hypothetical protein
MSADNRESKEEYPKINIRLLAVEYSSGPIVWMSFGELVVPGNDLEFEFLRHGPFKSFKSFIMFVVRAYFLDYFYGQQD